ncbi:restriction endonuclease subunit S [Kocuria rhizophila]|uniref:restriction endonuclease subunit S n=1 Tax=Kocuria rhizophila TaxID=72000 RepID=UPI001D8B3077|nr:restriction endonuclease subunit S [Kocuria rhizophila]MCC5674701.1 restriction endonuclease subunit S [Kocuria rhizophila]
MNRTSWLSSIPSHWTVRRAAHVIDMDVGGTPPTSQPEYFDGDIPWLTIADMTSGSITRCEKYLSGAGVEAARIPWSRKGDLLYSFKLSIGKIAFTEIDLVTNEAIASIHSSSRINLRYAYWMLPLAYEAAASRNIYGAPILNQQQLRAARLPVPPLPEQQQIADYLDHETAEIDALIKQLAEVKTLISDRRRTIIDSSFAHAARPEVALKYLGVLHSGLTLGKRYEVATQKYPYLRVANVQAGHVDLSEVAEIDVPPAVASENRLELNDVLLTEGGDRDKLGRGALWKGQIDPVLHQNHVFAFRCNSKLLPEYLVYALESTSARIYFDQTARQSTNLASTNSTVVKNFKFPAPPTVDQHSIVERLDHEMSEMQEMLANSNRVIDLARERRAALITAAVTGQIDVTARNKPAAEQIEDDIAQGLHREYA